MSSKTAKLVKAVEEKKECDITLLYTTLIGTIVASVGLLNKVDQKAQLDYFISLTKMYDKLPNTIIEIVNYVWNDLGKDENKPLRANLVLLTDTEEVRSPMVGIVLNDEVVPITPNGISYGIMGLAREGRPNVDAEYLYDENGEDYFEDFEVTE